MKLRHIHLENFKGVKHLDIPLALEGGEPRRLTCLLGDNGSGKTTVLQAIALTLSLATRRTESPSDFRWHGFLPERVGSQGNTRVELTVDFAQEEVELTHALFREWFDAQPGEARQWMRDVEPTDLRSVRLAYEGGRLTSPDGRSTLNQFLGRYYIRRLAKTTPAKRELFPRLGDVFWFDQYRNLGTALQESESWGVGVERLREALVGWWAYSASPSLATGRSQVYIKELERAVATLFPGTAFWGTMPREGVSAPTAKEFYFLLERDGRLYDIAEMSSGEQSIFSLLYEFVRLRISRSIVLIDELELHLHPPAQQALYAALPKLGSDCQFFITSHSEFLSGAIPVEQEVRLPGGRPCL